MKRHLLGFVVFSALLGGQLGCDDDKPRKRDAAPEEDTGGTGGTPVSTGGTGGGTGGARTGGTGGGGTAGTGGAPLDAGGADARSDGGAIDAALVEAGTAVDLARDLAADAAVDMAVPTPDAAVDTTVVTPDVAHDLAADLAPDLAPDVGPDAMTMAFMALPGCATAGAYTTAANQTPTVNFGGGLGAAYSPRCLKVAKNAQVTFSGTFSNHPLSPTSGMGSPSNPITHTATGSSAPFTFPAAGFFPYHCDFHDVSQDMHGAIWVSD
jgi:plastocyanin